MLQLPLQPLRQCLLQLLLQLRQQQLRQQQLQQQHSVGVLLLCGEIISMFMLIAY